MDALWGWCWRRFGPRYSWAVFVVTAVALVLPVVLTYSIVVAAEWDAVSAFGIPSAMGVAAIGALVTSVLPAAAYVLPGSAAWRDVERWAAGAEDLSATAVLADTYHVARRSIRLALLAWPVLFGLVSAMTSAVLLGGTWRVAEWTTLAAVVGFTFAAVSGHFWVEAAMRPARLAIAGGGELGDRFPRTRPTFGTWSTIVTLTQTAIWTMVGALLGPVVGADDHPIWAVPIALGAAVFSATVTVTIIIRPGLQPLRDLAAATRRVAAGDFSERLPAIQDDDLGVLAASFNRMQTGLAERERLQAAFGSYVDPNLAQRLLAQGDDVFTGERVDVTVMFVDIRDFTPFAEANSAEDTVTHLNAVFEIVVDAVDTHGGHVNKFLGDGAMVVFGAPELLEDHADRALACATTIDAQVTERFRGSTQIGIGINTGSVIAGTIGATKKREFTLIGDTVNVAARVEQLTKATGDTTLATQQTIDAATVGSDRLVDRGAHELKGKTEPVVVHALAPLRAAPA